MTHTAAPRPDHAARRARVTDALAARGLDGLLVTNRSNVRYLTGFSGSNATLLVWVDGPAVLATDGRYVTQAHREAPDLREGGVVLVVTRDDDWVGGVVAERTAGGGELAVEAEHLPLARFLALEQQLSGTSLRPVRGVVEELRTVKDGAELAILRRACAITAEAFAAMWAWLAPGLTEREVAHRLLGEMIVRGADGAAFDFIVAAGEAGAEPHHAPTDAYLAAGELVTVDAGARVDGYHADMTRTVALGQPPQPLTRIHDLVARAQLAGVHACADGAAAAAVDASARGVVASGGYAAHFTHPTGHGVGLDIHESPILHADQTATLRAGAVITVEPGIYVPGLGGVRIEDVVAVTASGRDVLTGPEALRGTTGDDAPGARAGDAMRAHELLVL